MCKADSKLGVQGRITTMGIITSSIKLITPKLEFPQKESNSIGFSELKYFNNKDK